MVKSYFLWIPFNLGDGYNAHVKPVFDNNFTFWGSVTETPYTGGNLGADPRYLGIIETNKWAQLNTQLPEGVTPLDLIKQNLSPFSITMITPARALELCNVWYPVKAGDEAQFPNGYFELDVDGFTIVDNRPLEV